MIRNATYEDIPRLMEIFRNARKIMRESGNIHQWNDSYPSLETIRSDIDNGHCKVLCNGDLPIAVMAFIPGPDPTYSEIFPTEGGENGPDNGAGWLNDNPYHVIHRLAAAEPGHGAAARMIAWAVSEVAQQNVLQGNTSCHSIRIDTHRDNVIMHHILVRNGFIRCGIIRLADGSPRDAYQKDI